MPVPVQAVSVSAAAMMPAMARRLVLLMGGSYWVMISAVAVAWAGRLAMPMMETNFVLYDVSTLTVIRSPTTFTVPVMPEASM